MKARSKFAIIAILGVLVPAVLFLAHRSRNEREIQQLRAQLQSEGFKTDLAQFNCRPPQSHFVRGRAVVNADLDLGSILQTDIRSSVIGAATSLILQSSNSAVISWKQEFLAGPKKRSPWPAVRQTLEKHRLDLEAATDALLEGPIGFKFEASFDNDAEPSPWTHLDGVARSLSVNLLSDLHYGDYADAWRHLLALTRLVAQLEAPAHSHRSRLYLVWTTWAATWHALQAEVWSDEQLATLENEWAHVNFFHSLPTDVAFDRAYLAALWEMLRRQPEQSQIDLRDLIRQPKMIPGEIKDRFQNVWYSWNGSYDDEKDVLLFLRDRESDLRRAIAAQTVVEMRATAGINPPPRFAARPGSRIGAYIRFDTFSFETRDKRAGLLAVAAEAEIRRRIILSAIALERFRLRSGAYPEKLNQISDAACNALIDFVDGEPLRYRRTDDGRFLLYSIGLDEVDNGGDEAATNKVGVIKPFRTGIPRGSDIVWPLPQLPPQN